MKKHSALFLLTIGVAATTALAAPFSSPNNIVVLRAGTASTGSQGFLDEYTPAGAFVQTITLPTTVATAPATGSGTSIVFGAGSGTSSLIHETSLSGDGAFVVIPGYAACGVGAVDATTGANNHRVIATVDYNGNYTLANSNPTWASGASVRGCASDGFNNFWGDWTAGVSYLGNNNPYAAQVTGGWRASAVINGTIFFSSTLGVRYFDGFPLPSLPTSGTGLSTGTYYLQSAPSGTVYSSAGFAIPKEPFAAYGPGEQGSVAYIANYNSTALWITPFTWNGASWEKQGDMTMSYGAASAHPLWLAVNYSGAQPILYFTTTAPGNGVYTFTDTSVTGTMLWGTTVTATSLFTPAGGTAQYRGITMAPSQPPAPSFTQMPANTSPYYGGTATFTAAATGANPYTWVWKAGSTTLTNGHNGRASTVSNATNATLTISGVTFLDDSTNVGNYYAIASNNNGTLVTSDPATLSVQPPCFTPPVSITNVAGTIANFTVNAASCAQPIQSISWDLNGNFFGDGATGSGSIIAGATTTSLYITNVGDLDAGIYTIHLYDNNSALSIASASLTVLDPPAITQEPANQSKVVGATANFTVTATGGSLFYNWFKSPNMTPLADGPSPSGGGATISGATTSHLVIANVQAGDAGSYYVIVTNLAGSINSTPLVTLTVGVLPVLSAMSDQTNLVGTTAGFSSAVTAGTPPFTYTWKHNGTVITDDGHFSGTGTTAIGIANVSVDDHRLYDFSVSNAFGGVTVSAHLWVVTETNKPNDVADLIIYDPFDYPQGPSPAVSFYSWENIISVYNRITGEPAYWVNAGGGLFAAVQAWDGGQLYGPICRNGGGYTSGGGRFPYPGIDCAARNRWLFSSSACNNHLHFGGVSSGSVYFSMVFFGDQGSPVINGTYDVAAGFTSGNSDGNGANGTTFAYALATQADVSPGQTNPSNVDGPGGWYFGVFKGGGINISASSVNGQWATNFCWRAHPYFIVGCYKIVSGGTSLTDDVLSLWVEPPLDSFGADEAHLPPPSAGGMTTNWNPNAPITEFAIRASLNTGPFSKAISDLRIGKTWASVTKPYHPTLSQGYASPNMALGWPAKDSLGGYGYKLQVSPDLANWAFDANTPNLDGSGKTNIVIETPVTNQFWRLQYPPRSGAFSAY